MIVRLFDCLGGWIFVCMRSSLHSVGFGQLLRCVHKRIVNIIKVYIERYNMQFELIRFRKKISPLITFTFFRSEEFSDRRNVYAARSTDLCDRQIELRD